MGTSAIRDVTFRPVSEGHALFLTLELGDPARLADVIDEAIARFTREHMDGPPDTRFMLIVVHGELAAIDFADAWRASIAHDARARALLGTMQQADVMQCDAEGRVIGSVSLLGAQPIAT